MVHLRFVPVTRPRTRCGSLPSTSSSGPSSSGATVTITRDGASPKRARSGRPAAPATAAAEPRSTSAPSQRPSRLRGAAGSAAGDAAFGQRYGETALGAVVSAPQQARLYGRAKLALQLDLELQVEVGHAALDLAVGDFLILASVHPAGLGAEHHDHVAVVLEGVVDVDADVVVHAQHADHRRGVDGLAEALVVEAHVAAHDRRVERLAGLGDALDGLLELPVDLALLRVAEVEAVGDRHRQGAGADQVAGRLGDRRLGASIRIEVAVAAVAVVAEGDAALRVLDAQHGGVGAGDLHGVGLHDVVVLLPGPALARDVGSGEELRERRAQVLRPRVRRVVDGDGLVDDVAGLHGRRADDRALVRQAPGRDVRHALAVPPDAKHLAVGDLADHGAVEIPTLADLAHVGDLFRGDDRQHALLALADHDLPGLHVGFAQRYPIGVDVEAHVALARHLAARTGEAGGAEVVHAHHQVSVDELEAGLDELLLGERVADLDAGPFLLERLVELLAGQHTGAADAVAAGLGADQDDVVADAAGDGAHD